MNEPLIKVIQDPVVSYDLAVLLHEKLNFNYANIEDNPYQIKAYAKDTKKLIYSIRANVVTGDYLAPTISLVIVYIRIKYGYHIGLMHPDQWGGTWLGTVFKIGELTPKFIVEEHTTPEAAYEDAITMFLNSQILDYEQFTSKESNSPR